MYTESDIRCMEKKLEQSKKIMKIVDTIFSAFIIAAMLFVAIACPLMLN